MEYFHFTNVKGTRVHRAYIRESSENELNFYHFMCTMENWIYVSYSIVEYLTNNIKKQPGE